MIIISMSLKVKCLGYEHFGANQLLLAPSFYLRNSHPTAIAPVLRHYLKQAS